MTFDRFLGETASSPPESPSPWIPLQIDRRSNPPPLGGGTRGGVVWRRIDTRIPLCSNVRGPLPLTPSPKGDCSAKAGEGRKGAPARVSRHTPPPNPLPQGEGGKTPVFRAFFPLPHGGSRKNIPPPLRGRGLGGGGRPSPQRPFRRAIKGRGDALLCLSSSLPALWRVCADPSPQSPFDKLRAGSPPRGGGAEAFSHVGRP